MDIAALPLRYAGANTGESLGWYQCLKRDVMACWPDAWIAARRARCACFSSYLVRLDGGGGPGEGPMVSSGVVNADSGSGQTANRQVAGDCGINKEHRRRNRGAPRGFKRRTT